MTQVFICYSHYDSFERNEIIKMFSDANLKPWVAEMDIDVGEQWWERIQDALKKSDGMVYLVSRSSLNSYWCIQEFIVAQYLDKPIFPLLLERELELPEWLDHLQYEDLSSGLSLYPSKLFRLGKTITSSIGVKKTKESKIHRILSTYSDTKLIDLLNKTYSEQDYSTALYYYLLLERKGSNLDHGGHDLQNKFTALKAILDTRAKRFTTSIPRVTLDALQDNPVIRDKLPINDEHWIAINAGEVYIDKKVEEIPYRFEILKYPITNLQYNFYLNNNGYRLRETWDYSKASLRWYRNNVNTYASLDIRSKALDGTDIENHPRTHVNWYEAMAFARWLSLLTKTNITLPNFDERLRSLKGNHDLQYPWDLNDTDPSILIADRCNIRESRIKTTTAVDHYSEDISASPFGVCDLCGNVWEWLAPKDVDLYSFRRSPNLNPMPVHGGGWRGRHRHIRSNWKPREHRPEYKAPDVGFRLIRLSSY